MNVFTRWLAKFRRESEPDDLSELHWSEDRVDDDRVDDLTAARTRSSFGTIGGLPLDYVKDDADEN